MKMYILNTGYLETDENNVIACKNIGTFSNPIIQNKWIKLPVMAFLIESSEGYILYDLGSNPQAMEGYWPNHLKEIYPLYQTFEERLENQLALCNVKVSDIKKVIISHLHLDHAGNLNLFKDADVYVPKADYLYAQSKIKSDDNPINHGGYIKADLEVDVEKIHFVEEDFEISKGVKIINLPGHTPGLLGLVVHLEKEGTFILPQDCIYTQEIYSPVPKASGLLYDSIEYFNSIEKVRELEKKYNAKVVFAHDWEFFKTLKLAPSFYE